MHILILGPDVADYAALCELASWGTLFLSIKKPGVIEFNVSNALKYVSEIIGNGLIPLGFF